MFWEEKYDALGGVPPSNIFFESDKGNKPMEVPGPEQKPCTKIIRRRVVKNQLGSLLLYKSRSHVRSDKMA